MMFRMVVNSNHYDYCKNSSEGKGLRMGKAICNYGVKILFLFCISFVTYEAFMNGADGKANKFILVFVIGISLAALILIKFWVRRYQLFFEKHFVKILTGYLFILFVVQIVCGIHLRYQPMWDLDSVYGGAVSWLENGNIDAYKDYFYYFPNNLGLLIFFRAYFGLLYLFLGNGMDYFTVAVVAGSIMLTVFRFSVVWIAKAAWYGVRNCYDGSASVLYTIIFCCGCILYRCDVYGCSATCLSSLSIFKRRGFLEGKNCDVFGDGIYRSDWNGNKIYGYYYCNCHWAGNASAGNMEEMPEYGSSAYSDNLRSI